MKRLAILICLGVLIVCAASNELQDAPSPGKQYDSPDLPNILGVLKNGLDIKSLLSFVTEFKAGINLMKKLMADSPVFKSVFETAANKNVKLRVLMKTAEGQFPDLHDLYQLATVKTDSISSDVKSSYMQNPKWQKLRSLWNSNDFLSSYSKLSEGLDFFTGNKLHLKPSLMKDIVNGRYSTADGSIKYRDMIDSLRFYQDNSRQIKRISDIVFQQPIDYNGVIQVIRSLDLTHVPMFNAPQQANGGKYTVHQQGSSDPDVIQVLKDFKNLRSMDSSTPQEQVQSALIDAIERVLMIFEHSLEEAEKASATSGTSGNSNNVVG